MVRRRLWLTLALAPLVCAGLISACSSAPTYPPLLGGPFEAGGGGGGNGGQSGGEGGNTECAFQGGMCTAPGNLSDGGNSCPVYLAFSCGPGSVTEAGNPVLICCGGYNDAGAPDVVDTGAQ